MCLGVYIYVCVCACVNVNICLLLSMLLLVFGYFFEELGACICGGVALMWEVVWGFVCYLVFFY